MVVRINASLDLTELMQNLSVPYFFAILIALFNAYNIIPLSINKMHSLFTILLH